MTRDRKKAYSRSHSPSNGESRRSIMVVDDSQDMVNLLRVILERSGYNTSYAYSGPQFFADLGERRPDLIILDVDMPHMDGFEVLKRLKGTPETASIPVIMLTAMGECMDLMKGCELGADCYIMKPFTNRQLMDSINRSLGGDKERSGAICYQSSSDT